MHPEWLQGEASVDHQGRPYGGRANDLIETTIRWNEVRAAKCQLIEVRGKLPKNVTLPDGIVLCTGKEGGTVPNKSSFNCGACGTKHDILKAVSLSEKSPPMEIYAI